MSRKLSRLEASSFGIRPRNGVPGCRKMRANLLYIFSILCLAEASASCSSVLCAREWSASQGVSHSALFGQGYESTVTISGGIGRQCADDEPSSSAPTQPKAPHK